MIGIRELTVYHNGQPFIVINHERFFMRILLTLTLFLAFSLNGVNTCLATTASRTTEGRVAFIDSTIVNVPDLVTLSVSDCDSNASLCIDLPAADIPSYQITTNGTLYDQGFLACDIDTIFQYYHNALVAGPFNLISWSINNANVATNNSFTNPADLVDVLNSINPAGNWSYDAAISEISGGEPGTTYSDLVVFQVGIGDNQVIDVSQTFVANSTTLNFPVGPTEVIITEPGSGLTDTFDVNVVCIESDTVNLSLIISDSSVECFDDSFAELPGNPVSVIDVCPANSGFVSNSLLVNGDSCLVITTFTGGTDIYCMEVCDDMGFCDTTTYIVSVNVPGNPGTTSVDVNVMLGESGVTCVNTGALLPNDPETITNICPDAIGDNVSIFIDEETYCVFYNGFNVGQDTACIVLCDDTGICDTTLINFNVQSIGASFFYDTVYLNTIETYCDFDLSELPGNLTSVINGCPGNNNGFVDFMIDPATNCVSYEGLAIGKDTACIYLTDDFGNQDTTFMVVCTSAPVNNTIVDTIRLDLTVNYCLDISQLGGNVADTVFFCDPEPINLSITPIAGTNCFEAVANSLGTDTICAYICDDLGQCDTTFFQITINDEEEILPPNLSGDADTLYLSQSDSIIINVCENDILPGNEIIGFRVVPIDEGGIGPTNGIAYATGECLVVYKPDPDFCGSSDAYSYEICNSAGCETAFVNVFVACPDSELLIFNGFSPNGDGVNDFWRIQGIESIPNNTMRIYNRWGNQLLKIEGYNNDVAWSGRWEGLDLPDGLYFYVLDYGNEAGDQASGWVSIRR
ncbi:MAG: gliding motility-associated C-terminal domain-containing protein [Saprospiraceae bacterium]